MTVYLAVIYIPMSFISMPLNVMSWNTLVLFYFISLFTSSDYSFISFLVLFDGRALAL